MNQENRLSQLLEKTSNTEFAKALKKIARDEEEFHKQGIKEIQPLIKKAELLALIAIAVTYLGRLQANSMPDVLLPISFYDTSFYIEFTLLIVLEAIRMWSFSNENHRLKKLKETYEVLKKIPDEEAASIISKCGDNRSLTREIIDELLDPKSNKLSEAIAVVRNRKEGVKANRFTKAFKKLLGQSKHEDSIEGLVFLKEAMDGKSDIKIERSEKGDQLVLLPEIIEPIVNNNLSLDEAKMFLVVLNEIMEEQEIHEKELIDQAAEAYDSLIEKSVDEITREQMQQAADPAISQEKKTQ